MLLKSTLQVRTVTNFTTTLLGHSFVENNIKANGMTYPIMKKTRQKDSTKSKHNPKQDINNSFSCAMCINNIERLVLDEIL